MPAPAPSRDKTWELRAEDGARPTCVSVLVLEHTSSETLDKWQPQTSYNRDNESEHLDNA